MNITRMTLILNSMIVLRTFYYVQLFSDVNTFTVSFILAFSCNFGFLCFHCILWFFCFCFPCFLVWDLLQSLHFFAACRIWDLVAAQQTSDNFRPSATLKKKMTMLFWFFSKSMPEAIHQQRWHQPCFGHKQPLCRLHMKVNSTWCKSENIEKYIFLV